MAVKVVIVGGSFGGLTTAYELRKRLRAETCEIDLISREPRFVYIPSLPWVVLGTRTVDQIAFALERPLASRQVRFIHATVQGIDPARRTVVTAGGEHRYDYLVIATGHRGANEAVPGLGHFGVGGIGRARQFLEGELEQRDIRYFVSAAVSRITESQVELADGTRLDSAFSLVLPPLAGVQAVAATSGLATPRGFVPVDPHYGHVAHPDIYAVGVAVAMPPVGETPVPVNFPKTAHMSEQMAEMAAQNIAAELRGGGKRAAALHGECILDMGDRAVLIKADPFRPPRNVARFSVGKRWLWAKQAFERYYLWRTSRGRTVSGESGW